jgi:hypothetical protein
MVHSNLGRYKLGAKEWDPREKKLVHSMATSMITPSISVTARGKCQFRVSS